MEEEYHAFITGKRSVGVHPPGDEITLDEHAIFPDSLFGFQRSIVAWAVRRRTAAVFADTGLGKSRIQLAFAEIVLRSK